MPGIVDCTNNIMGFLLPPCVLLPQTPRQVKESLNLDIAISNEHCFHTDDDMTQFRDVISKLEEIIYEWAQHFMLQKGLSMHLAQHMFKIFTIGALEMNTLLIKDNIEIFIGFSDYVSCEDLGEFVEFLQSKDYIQCGMAIVQGKIAFRIAIFELDTNIIMYYAKLNMAEIPINLELRDLQWLRNMYREESSARNIIESKITAELLNLIPNRNTFQLTLKAIILWTKRHNVAGSNLGFFGHSSIAIAVARICQVYPNAAPATLVRAFFHLYSTWDWRKPVILKPFEQHDDINLRAWRPSMSGRMPIITPGYPELNAGRCITQSGKAIILQELQYSKIIIENIVSGNLKWSQLFEESSFFSRYDNFVIISWYAKNISDLISLHQMASAEIHRFIDELDKNSYSELVHISRMHELYENGTMHGFGPGKYICRFIGIELIDGTFCTECVEMMLESFQTFMNFVYSRLADYNLYAVEMEARIEFAQQNQIEKYFKQEYLDNDKKRRDFELSLTSVDADIDR